LGREGAAAGGGRHVTTGVGFRLPGDLPADPRRTPPLLTARPALTAAPSCPAPSLVSRSFNNLGPEGAAALVPALRGLTCLTSLDLR
jgi:hypothetical protein